MDKSPLSIVGPGQILKNVHLFIASEYIAEQNGAEVTIYWNYDFQTILFW